MQRSVGQVGRQRLKAGTWIGGGVTAAAALIVRLWAGSPLPLLHTVGAAVRLPPLWLAGLLWFAAFFAFGCAAGTALTRREGGPVQSAWRLRGSLYGLLAVSAALLWYPMLFSSSLLWLSLPLPLLSCAAAVLCALCWVHLRRTSVLPAAAFCCFMLYLFLLQLFIVFTR